MSKKSITTFLLSIAVGATFAQTKAYQFETQIVNIEGKKALYTIWDGTSKTRNGNLDVENGQISHRDTLSGPLVIRLSVSNKSVFKMLRSGGFYPVKCTSIWFIAEPGSNTRLTGKLTDFAEVYPSGSKENDVMAKITKAYFPLINNAVNLQLKLDNDSTISATEKKRITAGVEVMDQKALKVLKESINSNASSIAALWFANDLMLRDQLSIQEAAAFLKKVDRTYFPTNYYQTLMQRISSGNYPVGAKLFEIKAPLADGGQFSARNLKGKYYLIDFWGTWCVPCMKGMPFLKTLKEKYADKLEIVGINQGDKTEPWKAAIKKEGLNWLQIQNGTGDQDYVSRLNIMGFPTKILVGPDGVILFRSVGEDEKFNQEIEKLLLQAK